MGLSTSSTFFSLDWPAPEATALLLSRLRRNSIRSSSSSPSRFSVSCASPYVSSSPVVPPGFSASSLLPITMFPAARRPAPNHQPNGNFSPKIIAPSIAVMKKLLDTLTILTRVVELERVKAAVKSAHMAMLKRILRPKNVPRRATFTYVLSSARPSNAAMLEAKVDVNAVVVLAHCQCMFRWPARRDHTALQTRR